MNISQQFPEAVKLIEFTKHPVLEKSLEIHVWWHSPTDMLYETDAEGNMLGECDVQDIQFCRLSAYSMSYRHK